MTSHLSVRFFCNAQQEEKRETQEESLQHADNNNNTRPKKQSIYVSWNIEIDHVFSDGIREKLRMALVWFLRLPDRLTAE